MVWAAPKKWPPGPTSRMASMASASSLTSSGFMKAATICSKSASSTIFSKEACSPPSIHPAACFTMFTPPMIAPHSENTDS